MAVDDVGFLDEKKQPSGAQKSKDLLVHRRKLLAWEFIHNEPDWPGNILFSFFFFFSSQMTLGEYANSLPLD